MLSQASKLADPAAADAYQHQPQQKPSKDPVPQSAHQFPGAA